MAAASSTAHMPFPVTSVSQSWEPVEHHEASASERSCPQHDHPRHYHQSSPPDSPASFGSIPVDMLSDMSRAESPLVNELIEQDHYDAVASVETSSSSGSRSRLVMPKIDIDLPRRDRAPDEAGKSLRVSIAGGTG
jgi:hypothetical protein